MKPKFKIKKDSHFHKWSKESSWSTNGKIIFRLFDLSDDLKAFTDLFFYN